MFFEWEHPGYYYEFFVFREHGSIGLILILLVSEFYVKISNLIHGSLEAMVGLEFVRLGFCFVNDWVVPNEFAIFYLRKLKFHFIRIIYSLKFTDGGNNEIIVFGF